MNLHWVHLSSSIAAELTFSVTHTSTRRKSQSETVKLREAFTKIHHTPHWPQSAAIPNRRMGWWGGHCRLSARHARNAAVACGALVGHSMPRRQFACCSCSCSCTLICSCCCCCSFLCTIGDVARRVTFRAIYRRKYFMLLIEMQAAGQKPSEPLLAAAHPTQASLPPPALQQKQIRRAASANGESKYQHQHLEQPRLHLQLHCCLTPSSPLFRMIASRRNPFCCNGCLCPAATAPPPAQVLAATL